MDQFDTGLGLLQEALSRLREQGRNDLRASLASLDRLVAASALSAGVAAPALPAPPEPAARIGETSTAPAPVSASAAAPAGDKAVRMAALRERALVCVKCEHLARTRTQVVFGVGNPNAELMFAGEAPGADEDVQGEPFVGKAGQLLTKIIETMGFRREDVYIGNVLKCRPDMPPGSFGNRKPTPSEMATCLPYLIEQIEIVQPRILVALGAVAMEGLIGATEPMGRLRGRWHEFRGIPLMATYHPAYLLRNQSLSEKRKVWEDMLMVLEKLERPVSEKQRGYFSKG